MTDPICRMRNLALEIGETDGVEIDDAELADAGRGEIEQDRAAEPARADNQHPRRPELRLAGAAHFAQHNMAGVALNFLVAQAHERGHSVSHAPIKPGGPSVLHLALGPERFLTRCI